MIEKEIIVEKYGTYYKDIFPLTMILGIFLLGLLAASNNFLIHYLLIISLLLITFFLQQIHRFQKVQKWQSIPAQLKDYKIIKYDRYDKSESNISTPDYEVYILYTYDYKKQNYESNKISYDKNIYYFENDFDNAKKYLNHILKNEKLKVYVNPTNSNESVLDNTISLKKISKYKAYVVLTICATLGILYYISQ